MIQAGDKFIFSELELGEEERRTPPRMGNRVGFSLLPSTRGAAVHRSRLNRRLPLRQSHGRGSERNRIVARAPATRRAKRRERGRERYLRNGRKRGPGQRARPILARSTRIGHQRPRQGENGCASTRPTDHLCAFDQTGLLIDRIARCKGWGR